MGSFFIAKRPEKERGIKMQKEKTVTIKIPERVLKGLVEVREKRNRIKEMNQLICEFAKRDVLGVTFEEFDAFQKSVEELENLRFDTGIQAQVLCDVILNNHLA